MSTRTVSDESGFTSINTALGLYRYRNGVCPPCGRDISMAAFLADTT